ncbi:MAG: hypothetical protein PHG89_06740 [Gallionella sp.]|nr:hypothetical protein [Gallionella sp.]
MKKKVSLVMAGTTFLLIAICLELVGCNSNNVETKREEVLTAALQKLALSEFKEPGTHQFRNVKFYKATTQDSGGSTVIHRASICGEIYAITPIDGKSDYRQFISSSKVASDGESLNIEDKDTSIDWGVNPKMDDAYLKDLFEKRHDSFLKLSKLLCHDIVAKQ